MTKVAVSIVSWNHMRYLPEALASVRRQTYPDVSLVVVDNASADGTSEFVRSEYPEATLLRNTRNLGFSRAFNQALGYSRANFRKGDEDLLLLVMNPDIILQPDCIAQLVERMGHRSDVAASGVKLLRVHARMDGDLVERDFSEVIDSAGLRVYRSRRAVDLRSGEVDKGFERSGEVFGLSGALVMFRLRALEDVAPDGEFFDEDFFAYKEDVDLAWRLRLRDWTSLYVPNAVAYHHRRIKGQEKSSWLDVIRGRRGRSKFVSRLSYRNHLLLLLKNERLSNLLLDLPWIAFFEFRKAIYLLLFEPQTLFGSWLDVLRRLPRIMAKRRRIIRTSKLRPREIRKWLR